MACFWAAKIKFWIKGHHRYNYNNIIGKKLECLRESGNQHSERVISVHSKKSNLRMKIIGHIPDAFVKVVDELMLERKYRQVIDKADGAKGFNQRE